MKTYLIVLFVFCIGQIDAQDFQSSDNTFLHLSFITPTEIVNKLDPYEAETTREKENFQKSKNYFQNLVVNHFIKFVYTELNASKGIVLKDKNALRDYIQYDKDGMPLFIIAKSAMNSVTKKGYETDYFFKFDISASVNIIMKGLAGQVKPAVTCTIKVFDNNRKVAKKVEKKIKTKSAIKLTSFPGSKFDKLDDGYMKLLFDKMKPQMEETVRAAISQL